MLYMKILKLPLAIIALFSLFLFACHKKDLQSNLSIDKTSLSVTNDTGSFTIQVTSNASWKLGNLPDWLTASSITGGNPSDIVKFQYSSNDSLRTRSASISFTPNGGTPVMLNITQGSSTAFLTVQGISVNHDTVKVDPGGQTKYLIVHSNKPWTLSALEGWIHFDTTSGKQGIDTVTYTVDANATNSSLVAHATLTSSDNTVSPVTVKFAQDGYYHITSISPNNAIVGNTITLNGQFGASPSVLIGTVPVTGVSINNSGTQITFTVPQGSSSNFINISFLNNLSETIKLTSTGLLSIHSGWVKLLDGSNESISQDVSFVMNNKIYRGLGYSSVSGYSGNFQEFDPITLTWTAATTIPVTMKTRESASSFTIGTTAFVGSGSSATSFLSDWWSFDGTSWNQLTDLPESANTQNSLSFVVNNQAYAGVPSNDGKLYLFDPSANSGLGSWTVKTSNAPQITSCSIVAIGNYAYLIGGITGGGNQKSTYKFDPSDYSFTKMADCPVTIVGKRSFSLNNKVYIITDETTYQYDPANNTWTDTHAIIPTIFGSTSYNTAIINNVAYACDTYGAVYKFIP